MSEENMAFGSDVVEPKTKKKLSKGKIILILVLVVAFAVAVTVGGMYLKKINSPVEKLKNAENSNDPEKTDELFEQHYEDYINDPTVIELYNTKLDELQRDVLEGTINEDTALDEVERIEKLDIPGTKGKVNEVRAYIEALKDSRSAYVTADGFMKSENYSEAIEHFKKVIEEDPNYSEARTNIESCKTKYREQALAEAEKMVSDGAYESAIARLESALVVLPDDAKIEEKIIFYTSQKTKIDIDDDLAEAAEYAAAGDYANAIRKIASDYAAHPDNHELRTSYTQYTKAYEEQVLASADSLAAERKYDEAIEQLKSAQSLLPDSQPVKDKIAAMEASKPTSLSSLGFFNGKWDWNQDTPEDPFGNSYSGSTNFTIQSDHDKYGDPRTVSVEYHVEGKYTTLTGNMVPYTSIHENATFQVLVYTDDGSGNFTLVYTSPEIGRKTYSTPFEANITGARFVKISLVLGDESAAILYDLQLWPK